MDKNTLFNILQDWNFWKQELKTGFRREGYLQRLKSYLSTNQILVITGPRRAGKSFVMRQLTKELMNGGVPASEILMVNFEDPRFSSVDAPLLQSLFETYLEFLNPKGKPFLFLDEVQEVDQWEKWVRTMHELDRAKIILSGSNAKLLSRELSTLLTGRHISTTIFPFSFLEQAQLRGVSEKIGLGRLLRECLEFGSFPEVIQSEEKKQILLGYFDDVVTKDLVRRYKIRKSEQLKSLAAYYFSNPAAQVTYHSLEKFLQITGDTAEKFSSYFEEAYLFFFIKRFSFKFKEQEKSPRKVYPVDTGLANTVGFRFSQNQGHLAEAYVFLELARRRAVNPHLDIFYWKDSHNREIDFVLKEGTQIIQLIQVCWDLSNPQTKLREIKSLVAGLQEFKLSDGLLLAEDQEGVEEHANKKIHIIPLWKWLTSK